MMIVSRLKSSHRFRRIAAMCLAVFAGVLTLGGVLGAPSILLPLAMLAWGALFLGLYLTLRIRLGNLINTGERQFQLSSQALEVLSRTHQRNVEDMQQMQLRIYRDLAGSLNAIRAEMATSASVLQEVRVVALSAVSGSNAAAASLLEQADHIHSLQLGIAQVGQETERLHSIQSTIAQIEAQTEVVRHQGDGFRQQLDTLRLQQQVLDRYASEQLAQMKLVEGRVCEHLEQLRMLDGRAGEQLEQLRMLDGRAGEQLLQMQVLDGRAGQHLAQLRALDVAMETMGKNNQKSSDDLQADLRSHTSELMHSLGDYKRVRKVTQEGMQWMKTEVVQEVESLLRLYRLGHDYADAPLLGGWAMDPAGMLGTLKLIDDADPDVIVELGSGTSTVWIAEHLRQRGKGRLISLDHLEEYAAVTRSHLVERGLDDVADVRLAPLQDIDVNGRTFRWYDLSQLEDVERIDFLLIDGPPTATGPLARYPAMPLLASRLSETSYVLLDDASRKDEKDAIAMWQQEGSNLLPVRPLGGRVAAFRSHVKQI